MHYRQDKYGNPLSILGYGCMRFPQRLGRIDMAETERLLLRAVDAGINYFDTAYIYPGSEAALGEILAKNHLRDKVNIATKLPHYLIRSREGIEKLFNEELRRLRTDHVDYYLMHMLTDVDTWARLQALGIEEWLAEKQQSGAIRQVGFSYHGNTEMFIRLTDAYPWDFCMIQYNYLDEHAQAGRRGLQYAHQKGLPVMIMEPLRGGRLVDRLPAKALEAFAAHPARRTPAEWAFRWLWDQPEVTCVLSGMSNMAMLEENIRTASHAQAGEMTPDDQAMLQQVVAAINEKIKVGCTGCGYCVPCPKGVDIPGCFAAYNRFYTEGRLGSRMDYIKCTALRRQNTGAGNCVGCGKCEQHCPQGLPIRQELQNVHRELEGSLYRGLRRVLAKFKLF